MATEYTNYTCIFCGLSTVYGQAHACKDVLTEARVRSLAREEIRAAQPHSIEILGHPLWEWERVLRVLDERAPVMYPTLYEGLHVRMARLIAPKEAVDSIKQRARDAALEEAACEAARLQCGDGTRFTALGNAFRRLKSTSAQPDGSMDSFEPAKCQDILRSETKTGPIVGCPEWWDETKTGSDETKTGPIVGCPEWWEEPT